MRYISLELKGYKRMMLGSIRKFMITPTERVQIILGTNGSGKSSLMRELSPLPAEANDFAKDGHKIIKITNHGDLYELTSAFEPKARHSFIKNGEELNPGGTITVQKELARQEFSFTQNIHSLLLGQERFTMMSPARRREWLTQLSDTNYDYALSVYDKLRERLRDVTGALKLAKKRLVIEAEKVMSEEELTKLAGEIEGLHLELDTLQSQRTIVQMGTDQCFHTLDRLYQEAEILANGILNNRKAVFSCAEISSLEHLAELIHRNRRDIAVTEQLLANVVEENDKLHSNRAILERTGEAGLADLKLRLDKDRQERDGYLSQRAYKIEGLSGTAPQQALETVYEQLFQVLNVLPENHDRRFSQGGLEQARQAVLDAKNQLMSENRAMDQLISAKTQMESHRHEGSTKCPNCRHEWQLGFSEERYAAVQAKIAEQAKVVDSVTLTIKAAEERLVEFENYRSLFADYRRCILAWPVLNPIWEYLAEHDLVVSSPRSALQAIETFRHDLLMEVKAATVEMRIAETQQLIEQAMQVGDASIADIDERIATVSAKASEMTVQLSMLRKQQSTLSSQESTIRNVQATGARLEAMFVELSEVNNATMEALYQDYVQSCIRSVQISLATKAEALSAATVQKGIVEDIERNITSLTLEEEATRHLVKALSPSEGLIADGLLGFIKNFTGQMNGVIRKIWSYPLLVLPCGMEGNRREMDYKFPLMVQTKENISPDVKDSSTGQREIVDLAFRVVSMRCLGLQEAPLLLDEFAASFDEVHRVSASHAIKNLMDQHAFSQLFMVSHYESGYGAMTNAQVCVLSDSNITIPKNIDYNRHVVIEN